MWKSKLNSKEAVRKATKHTITEQSSQLHFSISPYVSLNINAQTPKKPRGIGAEKD
jgi:hypothetical protein